MFGYEVTPIIAYNSAEREFHYQKDQILDEVPPSGAVEYYYEGRRDAATKKIAQVFEVFEVFEFSYPFQFLKFLKSTSKTSKTSAGPPPRIFEGRKEIEREKIGRFEGRREIVLLREFCRGSQKTCMNDPEMSATSPAPTTQPSSCTPCSFLRSAMLRICGGHPNKVADDVATKKTVVSLSDCATLFLNAGSRSEGYESNNGVGGASGLWT
eukprot:sb/3470184/